MVGVREDQQIKRFELESGTIIACANEKGLSGQVAMRWERPGNIKASILTELEPTPKQLEVSCQNGLVTIQLPETELALLVLEAE